MSNLWHLTAPAIDAAPQATGDISADVVVIGGGYTGLSAALHLAEGGADVCLIEAAEIGHGGSGRNVGLVNAGLWTPPDEVEQMLGKETGQRLNNALAEAPKLVFALIEKHGIACEAQRNGTLHCAHSAAGLSDLRTRLAQQVERGAPVTLLDTDETRARTGSAAFQGALWDARAGTIQPLAYARGLAAAAQVAGARLFEGSPALQTTHDGTRWTVTTPKGRVTARHLIRATNAYEAQGGNGAWFTPVHYLQCATRPLSAKEGDAILPGGEGCWDTAMVMSSFRTDAAGRVIIGGVGNIDGMGRGLHVGWARRKLAQLYPSLAGIAFDHFWCGRIAMTRDHLPKVVDTGPNAISIYGYSGRGIGPGTLFGKAAAEWVTSNCGDAFPIPITAPTSERFVGLRSAYYECGAALTHATGARR